MGLNFSAPPVQDGIPVRGEVATFGFPWVQWFVAAHVIVYDAQNSGPTAGRPIENMYVAKPYFDTDLGMPIWFNGTDWVDATGATV